MLDQYRHRYSYFTSLSQVAQVTNVTLQKKIDSSRK